MRLTEQAVPEKASASQFMDKNNALPVRVGRASSWLIIMCGFQSLWLAVVYFAGASNNWLKISLLIVYTIACCMLVLSLPPAIWKRFDTFRERLVASPTLFVTTICAAFILVGLIYARYQRIWTFDEEMSFKAARLLAENGVSQLFAQYAQIDWLGTNHPPVTPLVYGMTMRIFGIDLYYMRLVAVVFATGTLLVTYGIGSTLYDRETGVIAAFMLLSFPLIVRQGTAAMTDIPVTFFFALAIWLILLLWKRASFRLAAAIGVVIGVGLLTKYTMALLAPVLAALYIAYAQMRARTWHLLLIGAIATMMLATWLFSARDVGTTQTQQIADVEVGWFFTTADGLKWLLESLLTKLPAAIGVYLVPIASFGFWSLLKYNHESNRFLLLWIAIISVLLILTIPDHRYFMITFPAVAIVIARGLVRLPLAKGPIVIVSLLYMLGSLYLFVDWFRAAGLFVECGNTFC